MLTMSHSQGNPILKDSDTAKRDLGLLPRTLFPGIHDIRLWVSEGKIELGIHIVHTPTQNPSILERLSSAGVSPCHYDSMAWLETGSVAERRVWPLPFSTSARDDTNVGRNDFLSSSNTPAEGLK